jgi:hypothetical protein
MASQLSEAEQDELLQRLEALRAPRQRPSQFLRVFHVDHFPEELTLRREDEYGDDDR